MTYLAEKSIDNFQSSLKCFDYIKILDKEEYAPFLDFSLYIKVSLVRRSLIPNRC